MTAGRRLLVLFMACNGWLLMPDTQAQAQPPDQAQEVLIGFAGPLTEVRVQSAMAAARLALEQANQRDPRVAEMRVRFVLLPQDDKGDPRIAPLVAQYLINSGVVGVLGHWTSVASIAAAPVYDSAKMAQLSPASTSHKFTQLGYGTTFRIMGHDDDSGAYIGAHVVREMKATRIMIVDDGSAFGSGLADQFAYAVRAINGNIVNHSSISGKTSDFNAVLRTARETNADLIFLAARVNQSGEFARSMKRLGITAQLLATGGTVSETFLNVAGDAADGTMAIEPGPVVEQLAGWKKLQKEFADKRITDAGPFTLFAYDAAGTMINAILQANSLQPERISKAMHRLHHKGVTGDISFDASGNLQQPVYTLYQVRKSAWVPVRSFGSGR
jgi:branched-chain amino acid transport system substrate-binding protein